MQTKEIKGRLVLKHDTAANWKTAGEKGFCPLANEIIMFDPDDSCAMIRYKIGRWANEEKTELVNINDLPFESNVYIGRDEPVNAPAGFIWVDTSDDIKLITFSVEAQYQGSYDDPIFDNELIKTYEAEEGMTLRQWVTSEYNIDGWQCNWMWDSEAAEDDKVNHEGGVVSAQGGYILAKFPTTSWNAEDFIDCDEPIIANHTYLAHYAP